MISNKSVPLFLLNLIANIRMKKGMLTHQLTKDFEIQLCQFWFIFTIQKNMTTWGRFLFHSEEFVRDLSADPCLIFQVEGWEEAIEFRV